MKIGVIGAGNIGFNAAKLFAEAGYEIAIANSRGPETIRDLAARIGAKAVTVEEAAAFGDVVFVSIPFGKYRDLPTSGFEGKVVIDSNNYYPGRDGNFAELDQEKTTSSELLAERLNGARVVKAFNTIWFEHLKTQGKYAALVEQRRVIFLAGDDADAKATVSKLIEEIGFAPFDTGSLREGGKLQHPDSAIYNKTLNPAEARQILDALKPEEAREASV